MRRVLLSLGMFMAMAALAQSCHAGRQVIVNPYMAEWAFGRPVGWNVLGDPQIWLTPREGDPSVADTEGGAGCGLAQRVLLEAGKRYYYRVRTARGARLVISDWNDDKPYFQTDVNGEAVGFFTASAAQSLVSVIGTSGSFEIKSVVISSTDPDLTRPRMAIPKIPVFYSSLDTNMLPALKSVNMVSGRYDAKTTWDLLRRGVFPLGHVAVVNRSKPIVGDMNARVDELVATWIGPFFDTDEGKLPGGADGIIIDEAWTTSTTDDYMPDQTELWERSLAEVRRMFPNKVIAVWVSDSLGAPTPAGKSNIRQMRMLEKYADLTMLEIYQATCEVNTNPDAGNTGWVPGKRGYGRNLPEYATAAKVIHEACPGLLPKTVLTLVVSQNRGMQFEISSDYEFTQWLKVQMSNIPRLGRDGDVGYRGIGQWVSYRARMHTLIAFERYVQDMFLSKTRPKPLTDEDARELVVDANFENTPSGWTTFGPDDGSRKIDLYAGTNIPIYHDGSVEHYGRFARVTRGGQPGGFRQMVKVQPGKSYQAFVYALTDGKSAAANITVRAKGRVLGKVTERLLGPSRWWVRIATSFTAPKAVSEVELSLTDGGSQRGESVAYDFAGISPLEGAAGPVAVTSVTAVDLKSLPACVTIRGRNLSPRSVVRIGSDVYCDVTFVSDRELKALVPVLTSPGKYDLTVSRADWMGDPQAVTLSGGLDVR